ncbi:MAG: hypothetical protein K2N72_00980 [Oscillospiraceae bacterium]|nr:hypothetical protein [Oscillospiraceae bacterium]
MEDSLNNIEREFGRGNNVIVNTTYLEKTQIQELSEALLNDSQYKGKIIVVNLSTGEVITI